MNTESKQWTVTAADEFMVEGVHPWACDVGFFRFRQYADGNFAIFAPSGVVTHEDGTDRSLGCTCHGDDLTGDRVLYEVVTNTIKVEVLEGGFRFIPKASPSTVKETRWHFQCPGCNSHAVCGVGHK